MAWSFQASPNGGSRSGTLLTVDQFYRSGDHYVRNLNGCSIYPLFDEANNNAYNTGSSYFTWGSNVRLHPINNSSSYIQASDNIYWGLPLTNYRSSTYAYPGGSSSGYLDLTFCLVIDSSTYYVYLIYIPWYTSGQYTEYTCSSSYMSGSAVYDTPEKIERIINVFTRIGSSHITNLSTVLSALRNAKEYVERNYQPVKNALDEFDSINREGTPTQTIANRLNDKLRVIQNLVGTSSSLYTTRLTIVQQYLAKLNTYLSSQDNTYFRSLNDNRLPGIHNTVTEFYNRGIENYNAFKRKRNDLQNILRDNTLSS